MSANIKLARLFDRMAAALDLAGENPFKVNAYHKASRVLESLHEDVARIADVKQLTAIPGIGAKLAEKIVEYVRTGKVEEIDKALAGIPPGVFELLGIPGLGPKSVATLWKKGGVTSVEQLKAKLASGELENLPRMGKKMLEKVTGALKFAESGGARVRIIDALPIADYFVMQMKGVPGVTRVEYTGSLRRGRETVADVDLLAACRDPAGEAERIGQAFRSLPGVEEVLAAGPTKSSVRAGRGLQVDLRVVADDRYGAALMYFTGSKEHNVALRERAIKRGMTLNEYGLWRAGDEPDTAKPIAAGTEPQLYEALGLAYIAPELREERGEIAAAESGRLPRLIEVFHIKAELHAHTTASDGGWTVPELAAAAKSRGFHTVAITDHSASQAIANGLSIERLEKHAEAVRRYNETVEGITILAGAEVDILADGRLDYPDSVLAQLDIVVASPHAPLRQDPADATRRLIRAIENPYVHIIGHPTGRMVLRREGLDPDMASVIKAAAETGTAMEINANPYRLDLRDTHARAAVEAGVMLAIDTDAHGPIDLEMLRFGILTARRAWVEPRHVINCMSAEQLKNWLVRE